jgi:DNA-binding XRE family transcriptional regulator
MIVGTHSKNRARNLLWCAAGKGEVVTRACCICGNPFSEGHHEDYNHPLIVVWLCKPHHNAYHRGSFSLVPWYTVLTPPNFRNERKVKMSVQEGRFPLRKLRVAAGMTQLQVAEGAGLSRRFYCALETERQEPRVVPAILIARALDTTVEEAFGHLAERAAPIGKPK